MQDCIIGTNCMQLLWIYYINCGSYVTSWQTAVISIKSAIHHCFVLFSSVLESGAWLLRVNQNETHKAAIYYLKFEKLINTFDNGREALDVVML